MEAFKELYNSSSNTLKIFKPTKKYPRVDSSGIKHEPLH